MCQFLRNDKFLATKLISSWRQIFAKIRFASHACDFSDHWRFGIVLSFSRDSRKISSRARKTTEIPNRILHEASGKSWKGRPTALYSVLEVSYFTRFFVEERDKNTNRDTDLSSKGILTIQITLSKPCALKQL